MIRDNSPPEAHFETSTTLRPVAENINETESFPEIPRGASVMETSKAANGSSMNLTDSVIASAKEPEAERRDS